MPLNALRSLRPAYRPYSTLHHHPLPLPPFLHTEFNRNPPPSPPSPPTNPHTLSSQDHAPPPPAPPEPHPEAEVSDTEWDIRVARGMLHLQETLPRLFDDDTSVLFPSDIYSHAMVLKLPHPFPLKIGSLQGYKMAFGIARNGMQALHTELSSTPTRLTFSAQTLHKTTPQKPLKTPPHRQKQLRVLLTVHGLPRLHGLHPKPAEWHTSSLYTFNPYSGLIGVHEVEAIRPLPGEGVAEWVLARLGLRTAVGGVVAGAGVGCRGSAVSR